ncbi:DUF4419 domain-containing protein [Aureispira sp. CCB-E]|uniref:DUF4419 domain-containing protein n=1 Tax=Aureispira sp. CCB-E TaxID=3051121 RepID=UPI0028689D95|nr:DUF4419 domain-containing protein [Aureispira sp. CCB-E]WMX12345.1 DUF4419 domain-containing protein [Aureispira sp. CCB-E]
MKNTIINIIDLPESQRPFHQYSGQALLASIDKTGIEGSSIQNETSYLKMYDQQVTHNHFLIMLERAFIDHKTISLTPDALWLLICQGFSKHIKRNAEYFREQFVNFNTQKKITVQRNDFVKGGKNPWEEIFPEFSKGIQTYLKHDLYSNLVLDFSTTSLKERTAFEIAFMDSMSTYFEFELLTLCGIPKIELKGTIKDYQLIQEKSKYLSRFGLEWWLEEVNQVLSKIIDALNGDIDLTFWRSIYSFESKSGAPSNVSGWICKFFPFIKNADQAWVKNPNITNTENNPIPLNAFPSGKSIVPFTWKYLNQCFEMEFISGFIGIKENLNTKFLETEINWVIKH